MEVSAIGGANSPATQSRTRLADDFDNFLTLLTTQLAHQDPLDPVDSNEFIQQLVSFTGVEQAVATNTSLEKLTALLKASQAADSIGYIGKIVEAAGDSITLANGEANFEFTLPSAAEVTSIIVANAAGEVVFVGAGEITAGDHAFTWDGRNLTGVAQPDGVYTVAVSGRASDQTLLTADTRISGRVTGVETVDGSPVLTVNGIGVPIEDVLSVVEGTSPSP